MNHLADADVAWHANCKTIRKIPSLLSQIPFENYQLTKNLSQVFHELTIFKRELT